MSDTLNLRRSDLASKALTFVLVTLTGLGLCLFLGYHLPVHKDVSDLVAEAVFSALLAAAAGASWRSFQQARLRYSQLARLTHDGGPLSGRRR